MSGTRYNIGIDIGGTSVRAAVIDDRCEVVASRRASTPRTVTETEDVLSSLISELAGEYQVSAAGLAVAGFVSTDRSQVMFAPHLAWRGDPVAARLEARLGLPVVMDHDVNSAAWAEYRAGAAQGSPVALLVALGTGIGAGLVIDGAIYRGAHGVAPELGHVVVVPGGRSCPCGKNGCWERYCSGTALARTARELLDGLPVGDSDPIDAAVRASSPLARQDPSAITGTMVAAAAADGDAVALGAMADLSRWLGVGLAMATDILDPEVIVVGGGVAAAADLYLPSARADLSAAITGAGHRPEPRVVVAKFGDRAGIIGAALLAGASVGDEPVPVPAGPTAGVVIR
ncbi:glucokinase [Nakamurella panacisegetis]|uniref:Glucokinase n=1 Tax=Nakamurella panacisegetis TaxID=1090615 RepID=A0A1H0R2Q1_9ACTN|nr:ROK family protein [Nakamurella panacisegetis]SDP23792.1 glucokinase [Nakamurella panacisegetis]